MYYALNAGEKAQIVDCRTFGEHLEHHLIGAHPVPLEDMRGPGAKEAVAELDPSLPTFVYTDGDGGTAAAVDAAVLLRNQLGFADVRVIDGGLFELYSAGFQTRRFGVPSWEVPPYGRFEPAWYRRQVEREILKIAKADHSN